MRKRSFSEKSMIKAGGTSDGGTAAGGYITLYLTLTIAAALSLYIVLIRGARLSAAKMQLESVCRISENASLAEFHQALHSRYDLFFVDTSYGGAGGGNEVLGQHLRTYMEKNCERKTVMPLSGKRDWTSMEIGDVRVTGARYACDQNGRAVREQVYAYMSADPAGTLAAEFLSCADQWRGLEVSGREWKDETEKREKELKRSLKRKREERRQENVEKEENEEEVTSEEREAASGEPSEAEEMVDQMESFQFLPILMQVFGSLEGLSEEKIRAEDCLSRRSVHLGTGMTAKNAHGFPMADEVIFDRYILEKTGSCTEPIEDGRLRYQQEYILCGKASDRENLEGIAGRLLLIREASNCAYLFHDTEKMGKVNLVAAAVSLILFNPELEKEISDALALAWSYLESVPDVRTLMTGGKVPLVKTDESWQTGLHELLTPLEAIRDRDSGTGLSYTEYLQGLLFLEGRTVKTQRTMDIMEMDIRRITGNNAFRMDLCMDEFGMHAEVKACGKAFTYDGENGYN